MYCDFFVYLLRLLCDSSGVNTDTKAPLTPTTEVWLPSGRELHTPGRFFFSNHLVFFHVSFWEGGHENAPGEESPSRQNHGLLGFLYKRKDKLSSDERKTNKQRNSLNFSSVFSEGRLNSRKSVERNHNLLSQL